MTGITLQQIHGRSRGPRVGGTLRGVKQGASVRVDVEAKAQPAQRRSRETFDRILKAAGGLLEEVGMERISTNMVAERAGVSPAALYRYFPNKYALVVALAELVANISNAAIVEWIRGGGLETRDLDEAVDRNFEIQKRVTDIIREFPGGPWIARSMRALPALRDVANRARRDVVDQLFAIQRRRYPQVPEPELRAAIQLSTDVLSSNSLMVLEDPELDADAMLREACLMVAIYYEHLDARHPRT